MVIITTFATKLKSWVIAILVKFYLDANSRCKTILKCVKESAYYKSILMIIGLHASMLKSSHHHQTYLIVKQNIHIKHKKKTKIKTDPKHSLRHKSNLISFYSVIIP